MIVEVWFDGPNEGDANDDDLDGNDEVMTKVIDLQLSGASSLGPVIVTLNPDPNFMSGGEIEETNNTTPGVLDVPPFTTDGTANSFFDLFFEVNVGGIVFHTQQPKRMESVITHKPPGPGDTYTNPTTIPLLNTDGSDSGFAIGPGSHVPNPKPIEPPFVEKDVFEQTRGVIQLQGGPLGPDPVSYNLEGSAEAHVFFEGPLEGDAKDDGDLGTGPPDGLDEVQTELVALSLASADGSVSVGLNPTQPSLGRMQEQFNVQPGRLDVHPFCDINLETSCASVQVDSFFDVFVELNVADVGILTNSQPLRLQAVITEKPPKTEYIHIVDPLDPIELFQDGVPTGIFIVDAIHDTRPPPEPVAKVRFEADTSSVSEGAGSHLVTVLLELPAGTTLGNEVRAEISVAGGSATLGTDYGINNGILSFPVGSGPGTIQQLGLSIVDDLEVEGNETADFKIQSVTGPATIGLPDMHTTTIVDNDVAQPEFRVVFEAPTSFVPEDFGRNLVGVFLEGPAGATLPAEVAVNVVVSSGGSATSGLDYTAFFAGGVVFPAGFPAGNPLQVPVDIIDDNLVEGNELAHFRIDTVSGPASIGLTDVHIMTIEDNDEAQPSFSLRFDTVASSAGEGSGSTLVRVELVGTAGTNLAVPVSVDVIDTGAGTADTAEFVLGGPAGSSPIVFNAGQPAGATRVIDIGIIDDTLLEGDETVELMLANATGATIGTPDKHTLTIIDDDLSLNAANGHYYAIVLVQAETTWPQAKAAAEQSSHMGVQGHLATIDSLEENSFIVGLPNFVGAIWLGGSQSTPNSAPDLDWAWVTGEAWSFTNWNPGEPNDNGGVEEPYLEILTSGLWNDLQDLLRQGYVVEYDTP